MEDELLKKALNEYEEIKKIIEEYEGTPEQLFIELKGYNYDNEENLFDFMTKHSNLTLYFDNNKFRLSEYIQVVDDDGNYIGDYEKKDL